MADSIALELRQLDGAFLTSDLKRKAASSRRSPLHKRKIELVLKDQRVTINIQRAEVIFDFVQHIALLSAESFRHLGIHAQHCLARTVALARQASRLFENLVADGLW